MNAKQLARKIAELRERYSLSQRDLAKLIGLSAASISRMEAGQMMANALVILFLEWFERKGDKEALRELEDVKALTGKQLKLMRIDLELDQSELAHFLGVSHASVSRWEKGITQISHLPILALAMDEVRFQLSQPNSKMAKERLAMLDKKKEAVPNVAPLGTATV